MQPGGHPYDDQEQRITLPRYWDDPTFNNPLQPVVGVSWYEAAAYCSWLTAQGHTQGWLSATDTIRLPTSMEWERAARHTDQRRYPWGEAAPTPERTNYADSNLGRQSPVGCYPAGVAICGAWDMVGNTQGWMATPEEQPLMLEPAKDVTPEQTVLLVYNDFTDSEEHLCCGARNRNNPNSGVYDLGFRVMLSHALIV